VINKAISDEAGILEFVDAGLYGGLLQGIDKTHEKLIKGSNIIKVECITLDNLLSQSEIPDVIDFISIDVEGGELDIVSQMTRSKKRFKCGVIEHNNRKSELSKVKNLLRAAGYKPIWEDKTNQDLFFIDTEYCNY
jgi:FkbM family methyltransferase